jgi:chromosomal replication initiator protein
VPVTVVNPAETLWNSVCDHIRGEVSEGVWLGIFSETRGLYLDENCVTVSVPSSFIRDRIEQRYRDLVMSSIVDSGYQELGLELRLLETEPDGSYQHDLDQSLIDLTNEAISSGSHLESISAPPPVVNAERAGNLNTKYTFESFVTGPSNRFAQAAALSVAEQPARSYNPLFVYGSAGLGKTHLLQAIAHYVNENYPTYRVRYISTETLMNEFIDAIRNNRQAEFKRRYREIDVLLVDDVQFMEGKEQLQEEFFHTFNTLHEANRQIVLSSDRPPDAVATLEDRLRSRFKMGLVTDIQPPDFETRLAILRKKAAQGNTPIPSTVLEFIVTHVTNNIRELEGALNRVTAYITLNRTEMTVDDVERVLGDLIQTRRPHKITPIGILEATANRYDFTVDELRAHDRRRPLVLARHVAFYLFRELTDLSFPQIAAEFGGRDHTTIIHGFEKIKKSMAEKVTVYEDVTELIKQLKAG